MQPTHVSHARLNIVKAHQLLLLPSCNIYTDESDHKQIQYNVSSHVLHERNLSSEEVEHHVHQLRVPYIYSD